MRRAAARPSLHHARVLPSRDDVRAALPRAAQTAISAAVAWQICRWLGADRPVFAAIVPIVAIKGDPLAALNVSLGRLFGVVGGIALGIVVADVGGANAVTVALLIGAGLIAGLLIRIGGEPNSQVAVSALLVLAVATRRRRLRPGAALGDRDRGGRDGRPRAVPVAARPRPRARAPARRASRAAWPTTSR